MKLLRLSAIFLGNILGVIAFSWPLYLPESEFWNQSLDATWLAALLGALAIFLIVAQISAGLLDSKSVAIVSVLVALIAALRLLGAGAVGVEPMWFLLILASRVIGPQLGYSTAIISLLVSALLTGGIGPWLPFQIFAAGWIALGVHLIPREFSQRVEIALLALYGAFSSFLFGALMDLQLWPWLLGTDTQLSYSPGASIASNLERFIVFHFATAMAWDLPRAVITATLIAISGRAILSSLRRAQRRLAATSSWKLTSERGMAQKEV